MAVLVILGHWAKIQARAPEPLSFPIGPSCCAYTLSLEFKQGVYKMDGSCCYHCKLMAVQVLKGVGPSGSWALAPDMVGTHCCWGSCPLDCGSRFVGDCPLVKTTPARESWRCVTVLCGTQVNIESNQIGNDQRHFLWGKSKEALAVLLPASQHQQLSSILAKFVFLFLRLASPPVSWNLNCSPDYRD